MIKASIGAAGLLALSVAKGLMFWGGDEAPATISVAPTAVDASQNTEPDPDLAAKPVSDQATGKPFTSQVVQDMTRYLLSQVEAGRWSYPGKESDTHGPTREMYLKFDNHYFSFSASDNRNFCSTSIKAPFGLEEGHILLADSKCDGTIERIVWAGAEPAQMRTTSETDGEFIEFYMPVIAELFDAASQIKSWLPGGQLALLPDRPKLERNAKFLNTIRRAALLSGFGEIDLQSQKISLLVLGGPKNDQFSFTFSMNAGPGNISRNCILLLDTKTGGEAILDDNCDAIPEEVQNNSGSRRPEIAGHEDFVGSMWLEMERFASVLDRYFTGPKSPPPPPQP